MLCHKEEVMMTRSNSSGKKWNRSMEENGVASLVILRDPGDLTKVSQSKKASMKLCAFNIKCRMQKFGIQDDFCLFGEIIKL